MSCAACSAGQLFVIRVKDNDYMFTKLPQETSKSCSDDYYYDITTTSDKINPDDVRGTVYMHLRSKAMSYVVLWNEVAVTTS